MGRKKRSSVASGNRGPSALQIPSTEEAVKADLESAHHFLLLGNYMEALKILKKSVSCHGKRKSSAILHRLIGMVYFNLALDTADFSVKLTLLGSAVNFACLASSLSPNTLEFVLFYACRLSQLASLTEDLETYKRAEEACKGGLSLENPEDPLEYNVILRPGEGRSFHHEERIEDLRRQLENLINHIKTDLSSLDTKKQTESSVVYERKIAKQKQKESESNARLARERQTRAEMKTKQTRKAMMEKLRSFWASMSVQSKREFMKTKVEKLKGYLETLCSNERREALEEGLKFARKNGKWKLWMCAACSKEFLRRAEFSKHFKAKHAMNLESKLKDVIPPKADEEWVEMLKKGDWKPVDRVAAVEMIKNQSRDVKEIVYDNGWSKDWPLTSDENRETTLREICSILKFFRQCNCLSRSIQQWVLYYAFEQLGSFVPQQNLVDCGLFATPQCLCFLDFAQLQELFKYLENLATYSCAAEATKRDSLMNSSQIAERINFNIDFSFLLLDKRLLKGKINDFDDEGNAAALDVDDHCARVWPQGDAIISWLFEVSTGEEESECHNPLRKDILDRGLDVLGEFTYESELLEITCKHKIDILGYTEALMTAEKLCTEESQRRINHPDTETITYASTIGEKCAELVREGGENISDTTRDFLCAVRDILEGAESPYFGQIESENYSSFLSVIQSEVGFSDDHLVETSIVKLKSEILNKIPPVDAMILMCDEAKRHFETEFTRLSCFDYRSIILPLLKSFLREELEEMEAAFVKAKSDAAHAALLADTELEEEKKSKLSKKKKKDRRKIKDDKATASTVEVNLLYQEAAECQPSVVCESGSSVDDAKLKRLEQEDSMLEFEHKEDEGKPSEAEAERPSGTSITFKDDKITFSTGEFIPFDQEALESQVSVACESGPSVNDVEPTEEEEDDKMLQVEHIEEERKSKELEFPRGIGVSSQEMDVTERNNEASTSSGDISCLESQKETTVIQSKAPLSSSDAICADYNSALDMIVKSLWHIKFFREELTGTQASAVRALQDLFSASSMEQADAKSYYNLLNTLGSSLNNAYAQENGAAELLIAFFEFAQFWKRGRNGTIVNLLFRLEDTECYICRGELKYSEQYSYGFFISADSLREIKSVFGNIRFEKLLKVSRMNHRNVCDTEAVECGKENYVCWILSRLPFVFTLVLEWGNNESAEEISATLMSLATEIDIGALFEGLTPLVKYKLVSLVGRAEKEYSCMAYENNKWIRRADPITEIIGDWEEVLGVCRERNVRPEILFYEASWWFDR